MSSNNDPFDPGIDSELQPGTVEVDGVQTDDPDRLRERAAEGTPFEPGDVAFDDGEVRVRDAARRRVARRRAAEGTPFAPEAFEVEGGEVQAPDPTERVDVTVFDDSVSGDVEIVSERTGERRDLGADAGGDEPFFGRVDAPDREGQYRIEVGGETVKRFSVGSAGAAVDRPGDLGFGFNGTILSADRGSTGVTQEDFDPNSVSDPETDVVAGAGASEALRAGADAEQLSAANPISESEGERIAQALEQNDAPQQQQPREIGAGMTDQQLATRGSEANRRLREEVASEREGLDASQVDLVATDDGLAFQTDGETIGESELDFGGGASTPETAPSPAEAFDGAFGGETQDTGRTAGDVRAAVTRFGQRQLDQQAIGRANGPDGTTPGLVDRVLNADADPEIARDLTDSGGLFAENGDSGAIVTDLTGVSEADLRDPSDNVLPGVLPTRQQVRRGGADDALAIPADPEQRGSTAGEGVPERAIEGAATAGLSILNVRQRAADAEQIIEGLQALPSETRQEGAGDVGETIVALGRREGVEAARRAESEPVRFGSGLALDVAGGAVATGRVPDARDVRAEIDPRIGLFGETIESRALGLRSDESASGSDVDVDR